MGLNQMVLKWVHHCIKVHRFLAKQQSTMTLGRFWVKKPRHSVNRIALVSCEAGDPVFFFFFFGGGGFFVTAAVAVVFVGGVVGVTSP